MNVLSIYSLIASFLSPTTLAWHYSLSLARLPLWFDKHLVLLQDIFLVDFNVSTGDSHIAVTNILLSLHDIFVGIVEVSHLSHSKIMTLYTFYFMFFIESFHKQWPFGCLIAFRTRREHHIIITCTQFVLIQLDGIIDFLINWYLSCIRLFTDKSEPSEAWFIRNKLQYLSEL